MLPGLFLTSNGTLSALSFHSMTIDSLVPSDGTHPFFNPLGSSRSILRIVSKILHTTALGHPIIDTATPALRGSTSTSSEREPSSERVRCRDISQIRQGQDKQIRYSYSERNNANSRSRSVRVSNRGRGWECTEVFLGAGWLDGRKLEVR